MDEKTRHDLGAHYTSEENILKLIRPLFLDALRAEFDAIVGKSRQTDLLTPNGVRGSENVSRVSGEQIRVLKTFALPRTLREKKERLLALHEKIASLTFLDPACGCGNFLLIAYRELRHLEMDVLEELHRDNPEQFLDISQLCKVSVSQFHGIEIEPFPAEIAKVALWLMDHLCNMEVADRFGQYFVRIPIKASAHIVCANALTTDWPRTDYIMGNPPFIGRTGKSDEQQEAVASFFGYKDIDFVACWYAKASDLIHEISTHCAFVSTNSITQGEQVAPLWKRLSIEIDFAYRTFKWHNEAKGVAAVHCVIIGFHAKEKQTDLLRPDGLRENVSRVSGEQIRVSKTKTIFDSDGTAIPAAHINGYLVDAPDVIITSRPKAFCENTPPISMGNMPLDGGNLIIEAKDYPDFIAKEPKAISVVRKLTGSNEYINRLPRYCLWLKGVSPVALDEMPLVFDRVAKCRAWRQNSKRPATVKLAKTPTLFDQTNNPKTAIIIPKVSSERREYVPLGFIDDSTIVTDLAFIIPDATLYDFGILTSRMHMAWMRAVAGRLKSDYRYSKDIVYNNFIWPEVENVAYVKILPKPNSNAQLKTGNIETGNTSTMATISKAAQAVLDARERYLAADERCSLATLYDPVKMPPELVKAHAHLDALVDKAYGLSPSATDAERVANLFKLYAEKIAAKE